MDTYRRGHCPDKDILQEYVKTPKSSETVQKKKYKEKKRTN